MTRVFLSQATLDGMYGLHSMFYNDSNYNPVNTSSKGREFDDELKAQKEGDT